MNKILTILLLFGFLSLQANDNLIKEARKHCKESFANPVLCEEVYSKLMAETSETNLLTAYRGAYEMAKSKHAPIRNKFKYFNSGRDNLELALNRDPSSVELHFLRLTIQVNVPNIMGYNKDVESDKSFIIKNFLLAHPLLQERMKDYIARSENFTEEEKSIIASK